MYNSTCNLKGCISVTTFCIVLAVISSVSCKVPGFDMSGTHSVVFQNRLGRGHSLTNDDVATSENHLQGMDVHAISTRADESAQNDRVENLEIPQDHHNGRVKRSSHSGYVRFGKRFSPLIEGLQGHHNIAASPNGESWESMYDDAGQQLQADSDEVLAPRQQRAPESSYVRFGKRSPQGLSYSGCVAYTLARARNRSDLLRMLVENGCVKDKRLLHYAKKDGYIRFGK